MFASSAGGKNSTGWELLSHQSQPVWLAPCAWDSLTETRSPTGITHLVFLHLVLEFITVKEVGFLFSFLGLDGTRQTSLLCTEGGRGCALQYYSVCMEALCIHRTIQLSSQHPSRAEES